MFAKTQQPLRTLVSLPQLPSSIPGIQFSALGASSCSDHKETTSRHLTSQEKTRDARQTARIWSSGQYIHDTEEDNGTNGPDVLHGSRDASELTENDKKKTNVFIISNNP